MDETAAENDLRAQVGVGTLIIFTAMVLVAAIAAGVLISTADQLQSQAEATGTEATAQVSNTLTVFTTGGVVDDGEITEVEITVGLGPGSKPIDLGDVVADYRGPGGQQYIEIDDADGTDGTVLQNGADRATIRISGFKSLEAGDDATVTLITSDSTKAVEELTVPETLDSDDEYVRL